MTERLPLGKTLFIGGDHPSYENQYVKKQTWEFDGMEWSWAYPAIADRAGASAAFDPVRGKLVVFGGYANSVWTLPEGTWIY